MGPGADMGQSPVSALPTLCLPANGAFRRHAVSEDIARVERRIRASFARQGLMQTLGATLGDVSPGQVEIFLAPKREISQQHGFVHAGAVSAIADTAAGYAALSLMPPVPRPRVS